MNHLTVDEIIEFVSSSKLNDETVALSAKVNGHIRKCDKCMRLVNAFQLVHDEFVTIGATGGFENYLYNALKNRKDQSRLEIEGKLDIDDFR